ncbi:MAG TPA: alpha-N-acetylglucosaminidase [Chitinophagaceae bacterium]
MNKTRLLLTISLVVCLKATCNDIAAITALANRVAPAYAARMGFSTLQNAPADVFELSWKDGRLHIRGNNANSMAAGLNYYLKYYCFASYSWYAGDHMILPAGMPAVPRALRIEARCAKRFMLNYCTFGYTMPWWTWKEWEHFIDWMALNGVNLPLAITGQEYVWYQVWKKFGLTDNEIRGFFTGPAYLPWHRMANIDHWEGPLPMSWINAQVNLQQRILGRERSLNMKPVLPAFAGHVPEVLKKKYPAAKITSLGEWSDFDSSYQSFFLDPFDSLFNPIQQAFLHEQAKIFGTDHIYGTDPFNEVTPPSWDPSYLSNVARIIYSSMKAVDDSATWLQMTWIFYYNRKNWTDDRIEAYLRAVPQDKLLLLDYFCDKTEVWKTTQSFYGQPFLWCYLGNFGGNTMMNGALKEVESRMENSFRSAGRNLWGIGSTLEGFGVNPVAYEFVLEKAWSKGPVNVDEWIRKWAARRYGKPDEHAMHAWDILLRTTYAEPAGVSRATLTNSRPVLKNFQSWTTNPAINYDNRDLLEAWQSLNEASPPFTDVYQYDLVTVAKQVLGNYFKVVRDSFTAAYEARDLIKMHEAGARMMRLLNDIDTLLATNRNYLTGAWIASAMQWGGSPAGRAYFGRDAKKIISVWGQQGRNLVDYANRTWAGITGSYYAARWQMFIDEVIEAVQAGEMYNEKAFSEKVKAFEEHWADSPAVFQPRPIGNARLISRMLYERYAPLIGRR